MRNISSYKVTGLLTWAAVTNRSEFNKRMQRAVRNATLKNARLAKAMITADIMAGNFVNNSNITIGMKGSNVPLFQTGKLVRAIRVVEVGRGQLNVMVGIPKRSTSYATAVINHEGATISVTPKMRLMFMMLYQASSGQMDPARLTGRAAELWNASPSKEFYPIPKSTEVIIIPPRPFMAKTFESPKFIAACKANWAEAVQNALKPIVRRGKQAP